MQRKLRVAVVVVSAAAAVFFGIALSAAGQQRTPDRATTQAASIYGLQVEVPPSDGR